MDDETPGRGEFPNRIDSRKLTPGHRRRDLASLRQHEIVGRDQNRIGARPVQPNESALDLITVVDLNQLENDAQLLRRGAKLLQHDVEKWIGGVAQNADAGKAREQVLEQLEPLHFEIDILRGKSGDIALRAREVGDDADADRVGDHHDDRDRRGRLLGGERRGRSPGHDDVDRERNQKAASISRGVLALRTWTRRPSAWPAGSISLRVASDEIGLISTAMRVAEGSSSRTNSKRFATSSALKMLMPVRLPPGRARLATRPSLTGSSAEMKTIGIEVVANLAASDAPATVVITVTRLRTKSAANSGNRSNWFSVQR